MGERGSSESGREGRSKIVGSERRRSEGERGRSDKVGRKGGSCGRAERGVGVREWGEMGRERVGREGGEGENGKRGEESELGERGRSDRVGREGGVRKWRERGR